MTSLPSFNELVQSLKSPNPPVGLPSDDSLDKDLFDRLTKQAKVINSSYQLSYASTNWKPDEILDTNHKKRVLELFSKSGQNGKNGFNVKTHDRGIYKGEQIVCLYKSAVTAKELLPIIKP
jgi:hypothetical protein